jgi:predicted nucleic acid-binding protein
MDGVNRHGLAFWDAMLWATARDAGCQLILSEDFQDRRTLEGVTFLNPFTARNSDLIERALRPRQG